MRASGRFTTGLRLATVHSRPLVVRAMCVMKQRAFRSVINPKNTDACIRVVTYNVLADKYATSGWHKYAKPEHLEWSYRYPLIQKELQEYNADLLCLQEVDEKAYCEQFTKWLGEKGFASLYIARQSSEDVQGPAEGIAIFYRTSMFQLQGSHIEQYTNMIHEHCPLARAPHQLKTRQEGLALALLRHRPTGRTLLAACTHLFWNPYYAQVKALQAHLMCARIRQFLQEHEQPEDTPVVIGGDFNSLWRKYTSDMFDQIPSGIPFVTSGVYELLSSGTLTPTHPHYPSRRPQSPNPRSRSPTSPPPQATHATAHSSSPPTQPQTITLTLPETVPETKPAEADQQQPELHSSGLKLQSVHMAVEGCEPPLTTRTANFSGCLDYIWVTPKSFQVTELLELPYPLSEGPEPLDVVLDPLPNEHCPSDHIAMGCSLELI